MTTAVSTAETRRADVDLRLRIVIGVLCLIGIGIGAYLTYVHYAGLKVVCLSSGGCETVQSSRYAKLDGVPVATLGLAGYLGILITLAIRNELGRAAGFGLALVGFLFSMYLTYRELFTIKAICQWCVGSAVLMTLLAILTAIRLLRVEPGPVPEAPPEKTVPRAERRRVERRQAARR
jgi:uncharacterized membrane protein